MENKHDNLFKINERAKITKNKIIEVKNLSISFKHKDKQKNLYKKYKKTIDALVQKLIQSKDKYLKLDLVFKFLDETEVILDIDKQNDFICLLSDKNLIDPKEVKTEPYKKYKKAISLLEAEIKKGESQYLTKEFVFDFLKGIKTSLDEKEKIDFIKLLGARKIISCKDADIKNERKVIFKDISFDLFQGETLAILGENGAGKTVLMETMMGFFDKDSGEIKLTLGHDYYYDNLKEIGMQFQNAKFSNGDKVKDLIDFYKDFYEDRIDDLQIKEMLEVFGAKQWLNLKVNKLSGGQKQRINLMLAIISNPRVMILDEFVTGLDVNAVVKIIRYVNDLKIKNKSSMIIISHHPDEIEALADRILVLKNGKFIEETTVKEVLKKQSIVSFISERIKDAPKTNQIKKTDKKYEYKGRSDF